MEYKDICYLKSMLQKKTYDIAKDIRNAKQERDNADVNNKRKIRALENKISKLYYEVDRIHNIGIELDKMRKKAPARLYDQVKKYSSSNCNGYLYVILADNEEIKIGITKDVYVRFCDIEWQYGIKIKNWYVTESFENYPKLEKELHCKYSRFRIKGEWFNIDFHKTVEYVQSINLIEYDNKIAG